MKTPHPVTVRSDGLRPDTKTRPESPRQGQVQHQKTQRLQYAVKDKGEAPLTAMQPNGNYKATRKTASTVAEKKN